MLERSFGHVIVVGDANIDITIPLDDLMKNEHIEAAVSGGGTSANTAVALRKLGVPTAFMGSIGADYGGRYVWREFRDMDIDTSLTQIAEGRSTVSVFAFIDSAGERHLWAFPREEEAYAYLELTDASVEKIQTAAWVHASGMSLLRPGSARQTIPAVFQIAHEAGVPTSFDLNTREKDPADLDPGMKEAVLKTLPYVKYLLGSGKDEFYTLNPRGDWRASVSSFASKDRTVIARMGGEGTMTVHGERICCQAAYEVPVVNTTGAGDSFNAGFIAGMLNGLPLEEAVDWGNGVAGYKVSGNSARYTPDRAQLLAFLKTAKKRG